MGIFKTENCPICGTPTGALSKSSAKYNGLYVCQDCAKKLSAGGIMLIKLKKYPLEELQKIVGASKQQTQEHLEELASFHPTKKIGNFIQFDDTSKKFAIPKTGFGGSIRNLQIYDYSNILDYELLEDGNSISKGGVGRAIIGGALFGSVGAIVGGSTGHKIKGTCSKLQIKITMNSMENPTVYINFIESETRKDGFVYKELYAQAQEILSLLGIIVQSNNSKSSADDSMAEHQSNLSAADEIFKFKKLLDSGIISQEEFDIKKKQLLGL